MLSITQWVNLLDRFAAAKPGDFIEVSAEEMKALRHERFEPVRKITATALIEVIPCA